LKTENNTSYKHIVIITSLFLLIYALLNIIEKNSEYDYLQAKTIKKQSAVNNITLNFNNKYQKNLNSFPPPDSIKTENKSDSLSIDSTKIDSTARIKNFKYVRKNSKIVWLFPKRKIPFFVYPSLSKIKRTVKLDSTGNFVIIKQFIDGEEVKFPLKIPLKDYIKYKMKNISQKTWEDLGYKYELKAQKDDLGELLNNITNIKIPLPSVSFLSIFGPPSINLKINGGVDIHGAWRNETTEGITASLLGNTRNEPDFKQQVQINVKGTIGDKLTISADWNTERTFQYENQLKLNYKGYDDEIVQSVEAGNVSLQTAPLVGGGEALFGIKALMKFGPFSLTAIASQKKSEVEEVAVTGGSQKNEFTIHAYDYSTNHYFVDKVYADPNLNLFNDYYGNAKAIVHNEYRIIKLEVWKTTSGKLNAGVQRKGNAYIDLEPREIVNGKPKLYPEAKRKIVGGTAVPGKSIIGDRFIPLKEGVDYDYNPYVGFISFRSQINDEDAIAVAYQVEGKGGKHEYYGEFIGENNNDTASVIVLKLIKPKNLQPDGNFAEAWSLQLKNIYPTGGRDIKKDGFKLDINFAESGKEPVNTFNGENILEKFGLDKTDETGSGKPDGAFDWDPGRTILPKTGEIIFPTLQPFGKDFPFEKKYAFQSIYDKALTFARQDNAQDKFVITGEYSALVSSVYNIGFNVVENSVKVFFGNNLLKEGTDYSVDYNIGQVVIRNEDALVPGANLKITYEKNDLFQLASKTLVGLRGIYDVSKKTKLGFSYLNLNQKTLSDKVRIGEEPLNNSIFGLDFKTGTDLPFITKVLDNVISTRAMSSIALNGEMAYMNPDPNTKKSTVKSDGKKSIAYIDDFEGAKKTIPIGINFAGWRDISVPNGIPNIGNLPLEQQMKYKAESYWFNLQLNVNAKDIWGDRKTVSSRSKKITSFNFVYDPSKRGTYNHSPSLGNKKQNWGGMMRPLSTTAKNLVEEHIEFIEFWMHINQAPPGAKLYIDLGQISEDVIPNGRLDTEDKPPGNEAIDDGEDVGLDGLNNEQERALYGTQFEDPNNDDYYFNYNAEIRDYSRINKPENNGKATDVGLLPNTEDMNRNFSPDLANSYFRYEIPLDTNRSTNPYISGSGANKGWYQFRIPLKEATDSIGNPTLTIVETIRLWITGVDKPVSLKFIDMNLVGNQWQKVLVPGKVEDNDTTLIVSTINFEDNPEYSSPPGVLRERDRTKPDEKIFKNEQSLLLKITDLQDGDSREIVKYLFRPLDVFNYKEMKLFVHGDLLDAEGTLSYYKNENNFGAEMYFRFGTDTANYYEYRQPVKADWKEIEILFEDLTAIKQRRNNPSELFQIPVPGKPGHFYGIKGEPTLTKVNFFSYGIRNPKNIGAPNQAVSGELWINELRVLGADDTKGIAYRASSTLKFADLLTVNVNASQTDPYFHKLNKRFGGRVDSRRWGASANFNLIKLIPWNISGSNFNINLSHSESVSKPLYMPGTDIKVNEAVKQETQKLIDNGINKNLANKQAEKIRTASQTLNVSNVLSLSGIRFKLPSRSWYVQDFINNLQFSFNYNNTYARSPSQVFAKNWSWNGSAKYSLNFSRDNYFYAADIPLLGKFIELFSDYKDTKIYFTPQSLSTGMSVNRKHSDVLSRTENADLKTQRDFSSKRNLGFNWKISEGDLLNLSVAYNVNVASSYAYLLTDGNVERSNEEIWNDIVNGAFFGKDYNYSQNFEVKTKPKLPSLWNIGKYLNLSLGYNASYNWRNNFAQAELGRSAGYSNKIRGGLTLKLQSLFAPLFKENNNISNRKNFSAENNNRGRNRRRGRSRNKNKINKNKIDEKIKNNPNRKNDLDIDQPEDSLYVKKTPAIIKMFNYLKLAAKWLFFDYRNITFNFSQSNSLSGSGLKSESTGFNNFWGITSGFRNGPSRMFMLGFSNELGPRAPNGNLSDNYSQKNTLDFKTSRPLWQGAKIDLTWKVGWGITKNTRLTTDEFGNITINDYTSTGNINRTFVSFPFSFANSGIAQVHDLYKKDPNKNLSDAFAKGFESFPLLSKLPLFNNLAKYIPRANWRLSWRGLEKIGLLKGIAKNISLTHAYSSEYTEGWKIDPDGNKQIQVQKVNFGFAPLIGLNVTFDKLWNGNLTGSFKYTTKSSFNLGVATRNITESFSKDINFTASFSKSGFSLPIFGFDLKNDIEMSLSYTSAKNSTVLYEMENFSEKGKPQDGTTRTIIEPRIKYILSSKVTLAIFYKRTTVKPEGASRIPPTTTNEMGLDVHISIQ